MKVQEWIDKHINDMQFQILPLTEELKGLNLLKYADAVAEAEKDFIQKDQVRSAHLTPPADVIENWSNAREWLLRCEYEYEQAKKEEGLE